MKISSRIKNSRGFTLVEIIVVFAIIIILIGFLIPVFKGYIDYSHEKSAISECRALVGSAETIITEHYAGEPITNLNISKYYDEIKNLAVSNATLSLVSIENATVEKLICTASNNIIVTYEDGLYKIGGELAPEINIPSILDQTNLEDRIKTAKSVAYSLSYYYSKYIDSLLEKFSSDYGVEAYSHNRSSVSIAYPNVNSSEAISSIYNPTGKKITKDSSGTSITYSLKTAYGFFGSGILSFEDGAKLDGQVYFKKSDSGSGYSTEVDYVRIKVSNGNPQFYYYYPPPRDEMVPIS